MRVEPLNLAFLAVVAYGPLAEQVVQRDVRAIQNGQEHCLVAAHAFQRIVQGHDAGLGGAQLVEARIELGLLLIARCGLVGLQLGVELPNPGAHRIQRLALGVR